MRDRARVHAHAHDLDLGLDTRGGGALLLSGRSGEILLLLCATRATITSFDLDARDAAAAEDDDVALELDDDVAEVRHRPRQPWPFSAPSPDPINKNTKKT